jgi:hypothetical protein
MGSIYKAGYLEQVVSLEVPVFKKLFEICAKIETAIVDSAPGFNEQDRQYLKSAFEACTDYRNVLRKVAQNEPMAEGKQAEAWQNLRGSGLFDYEQEPSGSQIPGFLRMISTTRVLLQAIIAVVDYIEAFDPHRPKPTSRERAKTEIPNDVILGAEANIKFLDFFIAANERLGLSRLEQLEIFNLLFNKNSLSLARELKLVGNWQFPAGVWAGVKGYWHLKEAHPDFVLRTPKDANEDVRWGVDLIGERQEKGRLAEIRLYQIKGRSREGVDIFDLSQEEDIARLREKIQSLPEHDRDIHENALASIKQYARLRQKREADSGNPDCQVTPFWVETFADFEAEETDRKKTG